MPRRPKRQPVPDQEEIKKEFRGIKPLNSEQNDYIKTIMNSDIIFAEGVAGSGKTAIACAIGAEFLQRGLVDRLIISRPSVGTEDVGYYPGNSQEKLFPYLMPLLTELNPFINVKTAIAQEKIMVIPINDMRGMTYKNSFVIIDEAENCSYRQLKMILTRFGNQSKLILTGDSEQSDLTGNAAYDFSLIIDRIRPLTLVPENKIAIVKLVKSVRHPIIERILSVI